MPPIRPFDPTHFDPSQASPEMQEVVRNIEAMKIPSLDRALTPEEAQAVRALGPAGGESAGAHLSATTLLRMRDRHDFRFAAANLVYGLYDLGGVPSHSQFDDRGIVFDSGGIRSFIDMFVPDAKLLRDPDVSPLYANLSGLCPALFTVGTCDPLVDHSLFMYARWVAGGNTAEIQIYPGAPHGFDGFPAPEGRRAHAACDAFLGRCLDEAAGDGESP